MTISLEERKFKVFFRNSLDAIIVTGKKDVILDANPAAKRLFSKRKLIGVELSNLISGETSPGRGEVTRENRYFNYTKSPGFTLGTRIYFFRDITDKKLEDKRSEHFLAIAGHELKNPLSVVKALTHLISIAANKKKYVRITDYTVRINEKVDTLTRLINELLDITRIRRGEIPLKLEKTDIDDLVGKIVRDFTITNKSRVINVSGKTNKKIYLDKERITQVISNLLKNAIKYSPGNKEILITLMPYKKRVEVAIKDKGIGIPETEQKRIFELYYRKPNGKEGSIKGLGVGLFIAKEIIKAHKGKIWLRSKPENGTTFTFSIPTGFKNYDKKESIAY